MEATTGGTRTFLRYLLTSLDPNRFAITLIFSKERDAYFVHDLESFAAQGIQLIEVPMRREISPLSDTVALFRIAKIIFRKDPDIIHTHSSKAGFLGRLAALLTGKSSRVVYSPHSFAFQYAPRSLRGCFYLYLERIASLLSKRMVCVSIGERAVALAYGLTTTEKSVVIPNAISKDMPFTQTPESIRRELGLKDTVPVVGMVAQFRPQKGIEHFLNAIPTVLSTFPETRFVIIGDGPLFDSMRMHVARLGVEKSVFMLGHRENAIDYYQIMDMFVLTSLWEGMPYTILEAMAMGLPIVATDTVGNNELVIDGTNGFLVPAADSPAIARAIIRLLKNKPLALRLGKGSKMFSDSGLSIEEWITRYQDYYEALFSARTPERIPGEEPRPSRNRITPISRPSNHKYRSQTNDSIAGLHRPLCDRHPLPEKRQQYTHDPR